jgi:putative FmdB family regulatory protein
MPIYSFRCVVCGKNADRLMSWEKLQRSEVVCSCGVEMRRTITAPAKTASGWGDQGVVTGVYNKGLGCYVTSDRQAEQIAKSRGLVRFQDVFEGNSYDRVINENIDSQCLDHLQHAKDVSVVRDRMAGGADFGEALAETFSVDRMKADGLLSSDVNG